MFRKLKATLPYLAFAVILSIIGYLGWQNHSEFERIIINQVKTQLLITALSETQSVEKYVNDGEVTIDKIEGIVKHINDLEKVFVLVIGENGQILSSPESGYIGKDIFDITKNRISGFEWLKLKSLVKKVKEGAQGTEEIDFLSENNGSRPVKSLLAFSSMRINGKRCAIFVVMEYGVISGIINKNAVDMLLFLIVTDIVLVLFGLIFYRMHQEKEKLAVSEEALNIINKQLHCEIDKRKNMRGQ